MSETNEMRIVSNKIRCRACDDIIESFSVHDFKYCKCGQVYIDGGKYYLSRGWPDGPDGTEYYEELSEYEPQHREQGKE